MSRPLAPSGGFHLRLLPASKEAKVEPPPHSSAGRGKVDKGRWSIPKHSRPNPKHPRDSPRPGGHPPRRSLSGPTRWYWRRLDRRHRPRARSGGYLPSPCAPIRLHSANGKAFRYIRSTSHNRLPLPPRLHCGSGGDGGWPKISVSAAARP